MTKNLLCWIGSTDLKGPEGIQGGGPIAAAISAHNYDVVDLISDWDRKKVAPYKKWIEDQTSAQINIHYKKLIDPSDFGSVYQAATEVIKQVIDRSGKPLELTYYISPGTPVMGAVWVILSQMPRYKAKLIESSTDRGVRPLEVPFDIYAEFLPDLLKASGTEERLEKLVAAVPPDNTDFDEIVHSSKVMQQLIAKAYMVAQHAFPALIEGESGTGKEFISKAIHNSSPRREQPLIVLNCGAIPENLIEAELFGYEKGAFTGANKTKKGVFEEASGGSLFLDEIGELPAPSQVRLLRVLQEKEVVRLGGVQPIKTDVRIIAATNRRLADEVAEGNFREDLYYRLAVATLQVPALRDRPGDLGLLINHFVEENNKTMKLEKRLSPKARDELMRHSWPGNIRELQNTLLRAFIWSTGKSIGVEDVREAILPAPKPGKDDILAKPLGNGFSLKETKEFLEKHYIERAMDEAQGSPTKAAKLLGFAKSQNMEHPLKKYRIPYREK